jgi:hypothetical protein
MKTIGCESDADRLTAPRVRHLHVSARHQTARARAKSCTLNSALDPSDIVRRSPTRTQELGLVVELWLPGSDAPEPGSDAPETPPYSFSSTATTSPLLSTC